MTKGEILSSNSSTRTSDSRPRALQSLVFHSGVLFRIDISRSSDTIFVHRDLRCNHISDDWSTVGMVSLDIVFWDNFYGDSGVARTWNGGWCPV